eukprot:12011649-Heterocapsa_arctica.AAC.1
MSSNITECCIDGLPTSEVELGSVPAHCVLSRGDDLTMRRVWLGADFQDRNGARLGTDRLG